MPTLEIQKRVFHNPSMEKSTVYHLHASRHILNAAAAASFRALLRCIPLEIFLALPLTP